jgi:hypothetical protein
MAQGKGAWRMDTPKDAQTMPQAGLVVYPAA